MYICDTGDILAYGGHLATLYPTRDFRIDALGYFRKIMWKKYELCRQIVAHGYYLEYWYEIVVFNNNNTLRATIRKNATKYCNMGYYQEWGL